MDKYSIFELKDKPYDYLIIANSYENPINDFLAIGCVPSITSGIILFDLTLINGNKANRYILASVKNNKIDIASIMPISDIDEEVLEVSRNYFINHSQIVKNSVIPNALKFSILNKS